MVWLTGGALTLCVFMIVGLLAIVFMRGCGAFVVHPVEAFTLADGTRHMGELESEETYKPSEAILADAEKRGLGDAVAEVRAAGGTATRYHVRIGNHEYTGNHFVWIPEFELVERTTPEWAVVVERLSRGEAHGRFYGVPAKYLVEGEVVAEGPEAVWKAMEGNRDEIDRLREEIDHIKEDELGALRDELEEARLERNSVWLDHRTEEDPTGSRGEAGLRAEADFEAFKLRNAEQTKVLTAKLMDIQKRSDRFTVLFDIAQRDEPISMVHSDIVRAYPPAQLSGGDKAGVYMSRWGEFLFDDPREANQEGGIFPAIFGTIIMTLIMSILVVPFGVLAALYLREYAKQGAIVSLVRIAVNNLAGVPSIVFGVFGLGFFCYIVGSSVDELFFEANLPNPTFGKGGILWASLTLALLTLPVVIVATEEALSAVPNSMREGSYACGASKWQTIRRIVLPRAMPGILTGMILAVARGAGEVAPLMLVGAVKLAPELPLDGTFPFLHGSRSFMHMGFHIYDLGFQSPNAEAARPLVFTTTLVLIVVVVSLNLVGVWVRGRLRKQFQDG